MVMSMKWQKDTYAWLTSFGWYQRLPRKSVNIVIERQSGNENAGIPENTAQGTRTRQERPDSPGLSWACIHNLEDVTSILWYNIFNQSGYV